MFFTTSNSLKPKQLKITRGSPERVTVARGANHHVGHEFAKFLAVEAEHTVAHAGMVVENPRQQPRRAQFAKNVLLQQRFVNTDDGGDLEPAFGQRGSRELS